MKIVIIEDEKLAAEDLIDTIQSAMPEVRIIAVLNSVADSVKWFSSNILPDLIFSDIQLGDGLSFEIFKAVPLDVPVIFCTAYDAYALKAFDANGIDYILKPFDESSIKTAFNKYFKLKEKLSGYNSNLDQIIDIFENRRKQLTSSVLVYKQDKIFPVRLDDIALFYIENEITYLVTFDQKKYTINKTLEEIENITSDNFFRINRQFHINRKAVKEASQYFARKLSLSLTIPFSDKIIVSKIKVPCFLNWLSTH